MARSALLTVAILATLAGAALAGSVTMSATTLTHEANAVGWRVVEGSVRSTDKLPRNITIAVQRQNTGAMRLFTDMVSNPAHHLYTQYKTGAELAAMTAPSTEAVQAVTTWLVRNDVDFTIDATGSTVTLVHLTVAQASQLLGTTFVKAVNDITRQATLVGHEVTVPEVVAQHIEAFFGVHDLPLPPRRVVKPAVGSPAFASVTPSVITSAYKVSGVTPTGSLANRQAIVEFQGQLLSQSDLATFFSKYLPKAAAAGDDKVYKFVGSSTEGEGVEANLDVQYIMGVAPGIKTEAWQYTGQGFCADLKQWTTQIIGTTNPPNVFSVSYGWQGPMSQIGCSTAQIASIDQDFATIAASGISLIIASGDSGSGYSSFFGFDAKLYSSWPASSTYVTAVGATGFITTPGNGQSAVTQFGSGGGFSRVVTPAPAYQTASIKHFYMEEKKAPNTTTYGYGGRATPDVAALGEGFEVIVGGNPEPVGGTSAATPTFAAIVSLLNEARIQAGKKPLGFLNPWIYANADMLTDITVGSDRISRSGLPVPLGFDCETGYDPVTGHGTPDFPKMLAAAMKA